MMMLLWSWIHKKIEMDLLKYGGLQTTTTTTMETTNRLTMADIEMIVKMAEKYTENPDGFETELRAVFGDEATRTNVDNSDAPNIYPYKKCWNCRERKSCGKYTHEWIWLCEDCDAGECDECGTGLADEHIFTYEKDGEVGVTVCSSCADDMDDSFREQGYTRDDDESEESDEDEDDE